MLWRFYPMTQLSKLVHRRGVPHFTTALHWGSKLGIKVYTDHFRKKSDFGISLYLFYFVLIHFYYHWFGYGARVLSTYKCLQRAEYLK